MANHIYDLDDHVLVQVHNAEPPSDAEWQQCCELTREGIRDGLQAIVVYSEGGGPNAKQRAIVSAIEGLKPVPTFIMATSVLARGMVTAMRWLGKNIDTCPPSEAPRLGERLGLDRARLHAVLLRIVRLKMKLIGRSYTDQPSFEQAVSLVATPMSER